MTIHGTIDLTGFFNTKITEKNKRKNAATERKGEEEKEGKE